MITTYSSILNLESQIDGAYIAGLKTTVPASLKPSDLPSSSISDLASLSG